jgi:hypothetical protein
MKNKNEELIQQLIEDQLKGIKPIDYPPEKLEDAGLYELLFRELSIETDVTDNFNIADKIVLHISRKQHKAESIKYASVIFTISALFFLFTGLSIMFVNPGFIATIVNTATTHNKVFFLIVVVISVVRALDKILIKKEAQSINAS